MDETTTIRLALDEAASRVHPDIPSREGIDRGLRTTRRRRRVRRTARVGGVLGGLAAGVAALQLGLLSLPGWAPAVPLTSTAASALAAGPTRGGLADDAAFLAGLREQVASFDRTESGGERWRAPSADAVEVLYAGDVAGQRVALVETPLRWGAIEVRQQIWYTGPAGAAPDAMEENGNGDPVDLAVNQVYPQDGAGATALVVVGSASTTVTVGGPPWVNADGTVDWPDVPVGRSADHTWEVVVEPGTGTRVVTVDGGSPFVVGDGTEWSGALRERALAGIAGAERGGGRPDADRLNTSAWLAQQASGQAVDSSSRRLLWSGDLAGAPVDVLAVVAPSGAQVLTAVLADRALSFTTTLRALQPETVAFSFSPSLTEPTDGTLPPQHVAVFGPRSAVSADIGGVSVPLTDGVGEVQATVKENAMVVFLNAENREVAATTVRPAGGGPVAAVTSP